MRAVTNTRRRRLPLSVPIADVFSVRFARSRWARKQFCPDCVSGRKVKSQDLSLETHRTLYDSIALWLATWPLLTIYFPVITAPLALGMSIYAWNRPTSILRHSRWRIFAAMGIATLEIAGIGALILLIVSRARGKY